MSSQNKVGTYSYCTFFDRGYLSRGLALIESLRSQGDSNEIFVLCLDDETMRTLQPLEGSLNLRLAGFEELSDEYPELLKAKQNRSLVEFYFTCSPFVLKYSRKGKTEEHTSIYLDADLYFFGNPEEVVREIGMASVAIIEHGYPWYLKNLAIKYGTFNVGLLGFRNDQDGNRTLDWWASQCIAWCYDYPEAGMYADQGYLNSFPKISQNLKVLMNPGFNLAPWNTGASRLSNRGDYLFVDKSALNFFHFHGLKKTRRFWVSSQINYLSPLRKIIFRAIYIPYVRHLEDIDARYPRNSEPSKSMDRSSPGLRGVIAKLARQIFVVLSLGLGQVVAHGQKQLGK